MTQNPFSENQTKTLQALAETFFGTLDSLETKEVEEFVQKHCPEARFQNENQLREFAAASIKDFDNFMPRFIEKLVKTSFPDQLSTLRIVLSILCTSPGCFLLTGVRRYSWLKEKCSILPVDNK